MPGLETYIAWLALDTSPGVSRLCLSMSGSFWIDDVSDLSLWHDVPILKRLIPNIDVLCSQLFLPISLYKCVIINC